MNKKILSSVLAGITLLSIHSSVKAAENLDTAQINQVVSNNGKQMNIMYEPKTELTSGTKLIGSLLSKIADSNIGASLPSSYIPSFKSKLTVKNQESSGSDTYECWANALVSAYEAYNYATNSSLQGKEYSARHVNYSSSNVFKDQTLTSGVYNRNAQTAEGGTAYMGLNYSISGNGPVLESDMPSTEAITGINYSDLKTENGVQENLNNYATYPSVYKKVLQTGEIKYYNTYNFDTDVFSSEITSMDTFRNTIKQHIKTNGGVMANIFQVDGDKDIYVPQIKVNGKIATANHAVLIIGWDDDYLPSNDDIQVPKGTAWRKKGAYIALNSYGKDKYYDGFVYISYDDFFVEQSMSAITKASEPTYTNVYLHDELGCTTELQLKGSKGSVINVFDRATQKSEKLLQVGIPSFRTQKANVYYTETFGEKGYPVNFKLAKENINLEEGYTTVDLSNIELTKDKFAICVTYIADSGQACVPIEMEKNDVVKLGSLYDYAVANQGESYLVYTNSTTQEFDNTQSTYTYQDLQYNSIVFNAGIRAYTKREEETPPQPTDETVISNTYIIKNNMITRVPVNTTLAQFKNAITVSQTYTIVDKNGNEVNTNLVRTGYKVRVGTKEYVISVVSDISGSGGDEYARALDVSKMRAHLVELQGSILTGEKLEAADINGNGTVDIVDLLKLRAICVE